ncbi:hypothetical protein GCM10007938_35370 [Vibrio zhanjiangensis]|uniref:Uncharacterized protein n=1 Tax=Vibrio zhanjiangensis TaxID=1046128 RepID=A0ABQ6F3C4_9VIBR|nr:hypothetical protein [Vibrio zhanjiangensis]GLT19754.1 hypothetical protein GCM10007938_35370 [Vibrio zhanjiangensis]
MSLFNLNPFSFTRAQKSESVDQETFSAEVETSVENNSSETLYAYTEHSAALEETRPTPERPEFVKHFTALRRSDFY